ncbi:MAG: type IV pilus assembly protein PilM [Akkermansiaceae bacterium]|nr:type IV pilus assembly protein PilM [Akkermansiaceae bacterium]
MADYKTTVALEIGSQSVTMGVFTPAGRGFALSRYARRDILLDPVEEGMRMDYVGSAIAEMVQELKVRGSEVRNVVSGQQVFMRFIKLPAIDIDNIAEQVGFEAQQHIPFPLEDIIYSYQELADRGEGEREVLLVAIKKDVLDNLNSQVEAGPLKTRSVDCAITSLYNAFRANYDEDEPVMLLDIGAKTTDIIFAEDGRFFTRSVTAAGAFITNSIAREFNMSFREAEQLKIEDGVVSLGNGYTDSMGEQEAALATTIRTAMTRLSSEVQRTINHYRAQYKGNPPTKAYICGGGARLPFALEFLQAALNIPVEYLNPVEILAVGPKVDEAELEQDAICLGPIVGAAITGSGTGEFNIDLVPTSVGKERAEKKLLPMVGIAGVLALAGAASYAAVATMNANESAAVYKKASDVDAAVSQINDQITNVQQKYDREMAEISKFADLYSMRAAYVDVLQQLSRKAASIKFWFNEFSPLINYDVEANSLTEAADVKGTKLIDMNRSRSNTNDSAMNAAPDEVDVRKRNKAPMVTAIYVSGFTIKKPGSDGLAQRDAIYNLVAQNFDERSADSLFSYENGKVQSNLNHYFQFVDSKAAKGKLPDYVEKFMMVMPLKNPIPIPEQSEGKK